MNVKKLIQIILTCGWALILFSCGANRDNEKNFFHYNEPTGIASLDPAFAKNQSVIWPDHQLYNTLVETDSDLNIVPSLALRWDISEDKKTYTFHLRSDVFFHDNPAFKEGKGRKMIARDVEYSFLRIMEPETASPGSWIFNNRVDSVRPFLAIDDSTFQLKLLRPFPPVLGVLSNVYCSVVAKEAVEKYGNDFRRNPCGTGPFMLRAWEEGQALILARNPHYFEKDGKGNRLPYLDGVKVSFLDSKATEFLEFRQGRLDFINDIDPSFKDEILTRKGALRKEWKGKIELHKHSYLNTEYLGILVDSVNELVKNSPLRSGKIRQAINYGFDREKMVLYLRNSIGQAAESGFVPAGLPSFSKSEVKGYTYDPKKVKRLLSEAGYPGGNGLTPIKLLTIPVYADLGSFIAKQLEENNIPVQVEVVQKSLLLGLTANSRALFFRGSWIADYPDAENYLSVFYGKNPAPPNYTRYHNPAYDKLFDQAMTETNDSIRLKMYQQLDRMIVEDAPVVPLWYDEVIHLVQPNVKNFKPTGLNWLELRRVRK